MNSEKFSYLFKKYVDKEASRQEAEELMKMIDSGKYDKLIKEHIDLLLSNIYQGADMPESSAERILKKIFSQSSHDRKIQFLRLQKMGEKQPRSSSSWKLVAAVIVVMAGMSWFGASWFYSTTEETVTAEAFAQEISTQKGERTRLTLNDGSRVVLNADSKIQISKDFGNLNRELKLQGEAFFEVAKNPDLPFKVYTADEIYTEVLGTQFNIRSYEAGQTRDNGTIGVDVVVAEGSVKLGSMDINQPNTVVVRAGQKGEIGKDGIIGVSGVADINIYHGWIDGRLIFEDQSFDRVITELERWYDLEITVTDPSLYERRLSASFDGDPLTEVLQIIAQSLQIEFERNRRNIQFSPKS